MYVSFDQLDVYKKAFELACELHKASIGQNIPKFEQYGGLCDQLRRASQSICANMAEGLSKGSSQQEERRFLSLALGSCNEVKVWLSFGERFEYWEPSQIQTWQSSYLEIAKTLRVLMNKRQQREAA